MDRDPKLGGVVLYTLTEKDVEAINRRRPPGRKIYSGHTCAAMIVPSMEPEGRVDLQVYLDGHKTHFVTSVSHGEEPGKWFWPPDF